MRSRRMNAQSFTVEFIPRLFGVTPATLDRLLGRDGSGHPPITAEMGRVFQATLSGRNLEALTLAALASFADTLNGVGVGAEPLAVPDLYMWLRQTVSRAVSEGIWGRDNNPYGKDNSIIDAQW
jgi:hypothetical protein